MQLSPDRLCDDTGIFKCPVMRRAQKIDGRFQPWLFGKEELVTVRCYLKVKVLFLSVDSEMPSD